MLRALDARFGAAPITSLSAIVDAEARPLIAPVLNSLDTHLASQRSVKTVVAYTAQIGEGHHPGRKRQAR